MNERHCTPTFPLASTAWHGIGIAEGIRSPPLLHSQTGLVRWTHDGTQEEAHTGKGETWHNPTDLNSRPLAGAVAAAAACRRLPARGNSSYRIASQSSGDATHRSLGGWCTRDKLKVCPGCVSSRVLRTSVVVSERRAVVIWCGRRDPLIDGQGQGQVTGQRRRARS